MRRETYHPSLGIKKNIEKKKNGEDWKMELWLLLCGRERGERGGGREIVVF
jgi:hypothetical protein